jgi:hypothetical protein
VLRGPLLIHIRHLQTLLQVLKLLARLFGIPPSPGQSVLEWSIHGGAPPHAHLANPLDLPLLLLLRQALPLQNAGDAAVLCLSCETGHEWT